MAAIANRTIRASMIAYSTMVAASFSLWKFVIQRAMFFSVVFMPERYCRGHAKQTFELAVYLKTAEKFHAKRNSRLSIGTLDDVDFLQPCGTCSIMVAFFQQLCCSVSGIPGDMVDLYLPRK